MTGLLIAGTSSDAGKSLVVTGLCRAFARRGLTVTPFKAQNMSNNSAICADGGEIGRAQYLQAQAAGVEPSTLLNPVLLKPGSDRRAHVVLRGRDAGVLEAGEYATGRAHLAESAYAAYAELAGKHDLVVVEGAGSPAEINLRERDYVNMGLARRFDLPVVIVGDIDRGGVLASLYGTWALLEPADQRLLSGYVINKFRGDQAVLAPGLAEITPAPACRASVCCPGSTASGSTVRTPSTSPAGPQGPGTARATSCGWRCSACPGSPTPPTSRRWPRRRGCAST